MGFFKLILGAAEIAAGIAVVGIPGFQGAGAMLIAAGAGMVVSGIGTILAPEAHQPGFTTTERNPIAAQDVAYGLVRTGGTLRCL